MSIKQEHNHSAEEEKEYSTLNLGPTHPATHGIFQNVLKMDGETIHEAVPTIGYIHRAFEKAFNYGPERSAILERASELDRHITRLKRDLYRAEKDGESPEAIMSVAAKVKMRCPLLDDEDRCLMYEARPITCRLYGVPTAIGGQGHVCGFSAFEKGRPYPTVHMDKMQARLEDLSKEIATAAKSRFKELHEVYVPLSMALLTRYDEAYLGIGPAKKED